MFVHNKNEKSLRCVTEVEPAGRFDKDARVEIVAAGLSRLWKQVRADMIMMRKACSKARDLLSPKEMEELRHRLPFKEETFWKYAGGRGSARQKTTPAPVEAARRQFARAYAPWTKPEEAELLRRYKLGQSVDEIARALERQPGAIRSRLQRLGIAQEVGEGSRGLTI